MIQQINSELKLRPYLCSEIEDEGIIIGIDESLYPDQYAIIKVDDYYNNQHMALIPKSIDFLTSVDCECSSYTLYLLELKNVKSPKHLSIPDIHEKFQNTIDDFMTHRFGHIFLNDKYKYKDVKLYLVSDAYHHQGKYENYEKYRLIMDKMNKKDSLKIERSLGGKLFKFRNKLLKINYDIPPNPIIQRILT